MIIIAPFSRFSLVTWSVHSHLRHSNSHCHSHFVFARPQDGKLYGVYVVKDRWERPVLLFKVSTLHCQQSLLARSSLLSPSPPLTQLCSRYVFHGHFARFSSVAVTLCVSLLLDVSLSHSLSLSSSSFLPPSDLSFPPSSTHTPTHPATHPATQPSFLIPSLIFTPTPSFPIPPSFTHIYPRTLGK